MGNELLTILEVTDTHLKVVQGRDGVILSGEVRPVELSSAPALALAVTGMMRRMDINPEGLILVIPRRFAVLKTIELPSHSDEELRNMLRLQLGKHIPYSRDEVVFDFQIVDKNAAGYSRVLLAAIHKDVVERYLDMLRGVKLSPQAVVMSSFGVLSWWQKGQHGAVPGASVMVINIDAAGSEVCFIFQRSLRFSRYIPSGSRELEAAGIDEFLAQVGLTVGSYRKEEMGPATGQIIIVTSSRSGEDLRERLKSSYALPVEVLSPTLPAFAPSSEANMTAAEGFLAGGASLNFMPAKMQSQKQSRVLRTVTIRLVVLLIVAAGLVLAAWQAESYHDWTYLRSAERKAADMKAKVVAAEGKIRLYDIIRKDVQEQVMIADVIAGFVQLVPEDVVVSSIALDQRGALAVQGVVSDRGSVNDFQQALSRSPLFKDVTLDYATKRKRTSGIMTEFKMVCRLAKQKEGER